jgi:proline iminopeptidase
MQCVKKLLIIFAVIAVLVVAVGGYLWYSFSQPLYKPGMVREEKNLRGPLTPPEQTAGGNFWTVEEDIQLYHFSQGEGRNVLIVHGGPGYPFRDPWPGLQPLATRYKFHYYDQRGCGKSTRPIDTFSSTNYSKNVNTLDKALGIGAQIADIERIRHALGEEKLILIGHSWGGFLASLYAAEFPDNVEALILVAPADMLVMSQDQGGGLFEEVRARLPDEMQEEYAAFMDEYFDFGSIFAKSDADLMALNRKFGEYYMIAIFGTDYMTEIEEGPSGQSENGGWMVQAQYFSLGLQHDYRGAMKVVEAPVLVIHGADDLQPEEVTRVYVEAFPNATLSVIKGAEHEPYADQPEAFASVVSAFLNELE